MQSFNKFGDKAEVGHDAIVLQIFFAETGLLKQEGDMCKLQSGRERTDDNDRLMSLVIGGRRESMQDFSRHVGIGSKSHGLTGARIISLSTSLSETGEKCDKLWRVEVAVTESTEFGKQKKGKRSE